MKRAAWKNIVTSKNILTPVKVKKKGGYPRGTKPGQGGIVGLSFDAGSGGMSEGTETAFWDMPFVKEILGFNPRDQYAEDEEIRAEDNTLDDEELADKLADKIMSLKDKSIPAEKKEEEINQIVDEIASDESTKEDPNKAGLIRFVKGAHLVYKRQVEDGSYEELWIYSIDKMNTGTKTKHAILAGSDIDINAEQSEDGKQNCELVTVGNAQMLKIVGLPN